MSAHHDNHSAEPKKVSFRVPLILALVTVFIILLLVSTCDCHHGCCKEGEKCETSCAEGHDAHHDQAAAAPAEEHAH